MAESISPTVHFEWGNIGQSFWICVLPSGKERQEYLLQDIFIHHALG